MAKDSNEETSVVRQRPTGWGCARLIFGSGSFFIIYGLLYTDQGAWTSIPSRVIRPREGRGWEGCTGEREKKGMRERARGDTTTRGMTRARKTQERLPIAMLQDERVGESSNVGATVKGENAD